MGRGPGHSQVDFWLILQSGNWHEHYRVLHQPSLSLGYEVKKLLVSSLCALLLVGPRQPSRLSWQPGT